MSGHSYILRWSSKNENFTTVSGQVSIQGGVSVGSGNRYIPKGGNENVLSITIGGNVGSASSNCTIFGFCNDL